MSHLSFLILLIIFGNFNELLSRYLKCKRSSLRSQCWKMRLFEWFFKHCEHCNRLFKKSAIFLKVLCATKPFGVRTREMPKMHSANYILTVKPFLSLTIFDMIDFLLFRHLLQSTFLAWKMWPFVASIHVNLNFLDLWQNTRKKSNTLVTFSSDVDPPNTLLKHVGKSIIHFLS